MTAFWKSIHPDDRFNVGCAIGFVIGMGLGGVIAILVFSFV